MEYDAARLERDLLGMCCMDWAFFVRHHDLSPEIFSLSDHRRIWKQMQVLYHQGNDGTNIMADLGVGFAQQDGHGGMGSVVGALVDGIPKVFAPEGYLKHLLDRHRRRRLIEIGERIRTVAHTEDDPEGRVLAEVDKLLQERTHDCLCRRIGEMRSGYLAAQGDSRRISVGYPSLDDHLHPARRRLLIMAAFSSVGKTAWLLNVIVKALLADPTKHIILFSLEGSEEEIYQRVHQILLGIPSYEVARLEEHAEVDMPTENLRVICQSDLSFPTMRAEIKRVELGDWHAPADIVGIDYLGLVDPGKKISGEYETTHELALQVQRFAKMQDSLTICVNQLSGEGSPCARPDLRHVRGSKQLISAANYLLLAWRPGWGKEDDHDFKIFISKNKDGPQAELTYGWTGPTLRIEEGYQF